MRNELKALIQRSRDIPPFQYKGKPVVIYGAGQMGVAAAETLKNAGVDVKFFLDKNEAREHEMTEGIEILHPERANGYINKEDVIVAIALVVVSYNEIESYLKGLGFKDICFIGQLIPAITTAPSVIYQWGSEINAEEEEKLMYCFDNYDDESKRAMLQFLYWKLDGIEKDYYKPLSIAERYFPKEITDVLNDEEVFVDCGAYKGESIEKIYKVTNGKFKKIYAFEPDKENYAKLKDYIAAKDDERLKAFPYGLGDKDGQQNFLSMRGYLSRFVDFETGEKSELIELDDFAEKNEFTFLKVYSAGVAKEIVKGGLKAIKSKRPVFAIVCSHNKKDYVEVQYELRKSLDKYMLLLKQHEYCANTAIIYGIPKERLDECRNRNEI